MKKLLSFTFVYFLSCFSVTIHNNTERDMAVILQGFSGCLKEDVHLQVKTQETVSYPTPDKKCEGTITAIGYTPDQSGGIPIKLTPDALQEVKGPLKSSYEIKEENGTLKIY